MKRSWIGFALLLVLLLASIFVTIFMSRIHKPIEIDLNQAAECALMADWDNTCRYFRSARDQWEKWAHLRACFADHTPVEEIDASFALLEVYCQSRDSVSFAAACRQTARQAAAVGEAHEMVWWNLF